MKQNGMQDFTEQASIGLLGISGRKANRRHKSCYEKFLEAVANLPPPPCTGCPFQRRCATQELACEVFWEYAHARPNGLPKQPWPYETPPTQQPSKRIYDMLHDPEADKGRNRGPSLRAVSKGYS